MNKPIRVMKKMSVLLLPILLGGLTGWAEQPALTNFNVEFSIIAPDAHIVNLTGEFNNWSPVATPLHKRTNGTWVATLKLASGRYQYKFIVDGKWMPDPENTERADDPYGGKSSVVVVARPMRPVTPPPSTNSLATQCYYVEFTADAPDARVVSLTGEFNGWSPTATPMNKRFNGVWAAIVQLAPGRYEYKIVVDGKPIPDPENPTQVDDGHGGRNSVVVIGGAD